MSWYFDRKFLLNINTIMLCFILMVYNMVQRNDYLVFLCVTITFMYMAVDLLSPFEFKLWTVLVTLGSLVYFR
jgi:hypothetical protein